MGGFWRGQRVNSTPPLSTSNRFAVLSVEEVYESNSISSTDNTSNDPKAVLTPPPSRNRFPKRPNWEKRLPERYVVASNPSANSFELPISMQTLDTGEILATNALLDSGATDLFVSSDFVAQHHLTTRKLSRPIPVYNVDGSPNESGSISEVFETILRYRDHSERARFAVTGLGKQNIILGLTWLRKHNPKVDWTSGEVKMSRCPDHCRTCQNEVKEERKGAFKESESIQSCQAGPMPSVDVDMGDVPDVEGDDDFDCPGLPDVH